VLILIDRLRKDAAAFNIENNSHGDDWTHKAQGSV
jgi:hypothetical protein